MLIHIRTYVAHMYIRTYVYVATYVYTVYISRYHGKCGISLWVISYIPWFELAVKHLGINH